MSKNKYLYFLYFSVFFFLTLRILTLAIISNDRELPIEVDDSYSYISKSTFVENYKNNKLLISSRKIVNDTFVLDKNNSTLQRYLRITDYTYTPNYLHSQLLIYFYNFGFSHEKIIWSLYYLGQLIILLSFYYLCKYFVSSKKNFIPIAILFGSFSFLFFFHQLKSTPYSIGSALFIISFVLFSERKNALPIFLLVISLLFHPGIFIIAFVFIFSLIIYSFFYENNINIKRNLFFTSVIFLVLLIDFISVNFYGNRTFTYFFSHSDNFYNLSYIEIFLFNFKKWLSRINNILGIYSYKYIGILIYFFSLIIVYKFNRKLFIFNINFLLLFILSLLYYLPAHPAELLLYFGQTFSIILICTNLYFYEYLYYLIRKTKSLSWNSILLFTAIFFISTLFYSVTKVIKSRSERHNFPLYSNELIGINNDFQGYQIVLSDQFTLLMSIPYLKNLYGLLDNDILVNTKWVQNECNDRVLYFGFEKNEINVCNKNYLLHKHLVYKSGEYCISEFRAY